MFSSYNKPEKSEESCTFVGKKLKKNITMKIFPSSSIKKLDAYTIEHEPIASIDLMERAATVLTKAITDRWSTDTPSPFLPDRETMAETR
ncbi:hypothetical protein BFINE_26110 [Bacteroides finegoldii DSM 17565]|nr:hypothetical protein BFINE_26110 [Bacteroides finegoldii DSM 17565]